MSLLVIGTQNQYAATPIVAGSIPVAAGGPVSMLAMVRAIAGSSYVMSIGTNGSGQAYALGLNGSLQPFIEVIDASADVQQAHSSAVVAGRGAAIGLVQVSGTSRFVYLNGVGVANTTASSPVATLQNLSLGDLFSFGGHSGYSTTLINRATFWNAALTPAEVLAFSQGVHPGRIRPESIFAGPYFDESRRGGWDQSGHKLNLILGGTTLPVVSEDPPGLRAPNARRWLIARRAAGPTTVTLTPATEADTARAITVRKRVTLTPGAETEAATAAAVTKLATLASAGETTTAQALTTHKRVTLSAAAETDAAPALTTAKLVTLTPASETDSGVSLSMAKRVTVAAADEADTAVALGTSHGSAITITLIPASATDQPEPLELAKRVTLTAAGDTSATVAVTVSKLATLGTATSLDVAVGRSIRTVVRFTAAAEHDSAIGLIIGGESRALVVALDTARLADFVTSGGTSAGFERASGRAAGERPQTVAGFERPRVAASFEQAEAEIFA